jgi:hypothetical protein
MVRSGGTKRKSQALLDSDSDSDASGSGSGSGSDLEKVGSMFNVLIDIVQSQSKIHLDDISN